MLWRMLAVLAFNNVKLLHRLASRISDIIALRGIKTTNSLSQHTSCQDVILQNASAVNEV